MRPPIRRATAVLVIVAAITGPPGRMLAAPPSPELPQFVTRKSSAAIEKGLQYLAFTQRPNGSWPSRYPVAMTSLAGLALMAGGSTPEEGRYARHVKKAMLYILAAAKGNKSGILSNESRPMYGHGFGMLFLAECYGVDSSNDYSKAIKATLDKAVKLTVTGQSANGGWTYTPNSGDEGSVTVTQLQALRACRNVGIKVPRETVKKAVAYLKACQMPDGGICYSYSSRNGGRSREAISAAAIACFYAAGVYNLESAEGKVVKKLISYCTENIKAGGGGMGHYFYTHFYMAQAMYYRGGKDYEDYYPPMRDNLLTRQHADGSWMGDSVDTTYGTALACIVLQLPYGYLPIYQR